jgi:hypothetical protein
MPIDPSEYYGEYHGHTLSHLEVALEALRGGPDATPATARPVVFLVGDSTLDNKFWLSHNVSSMVSAPRGMRDFLSPPRCVRDVATCLAVELDERLGDGAWRSFLKGDDKSSWRAIAASGMPTLLSPRIPLSNTGRYGTLLARSPRRPWRAELRCRGEHAARSRRFQWTAHTRA